MTDQTLTEVQYTGFTVINPGTTKLKFHIQSNDIREILATDEIIDWDFCYNTQHGTDEQKTRLDARCMFPIEYLLQFCPYHQIISTIKDNRSGDVAEFYHVLMEQLNILTAVVREDYVNGNYIPYGVLCLALTKGQVVRINGDNGVVHAGTIVSTRYGSNYRLGKYLAVGINIIVAHNCGVYKYGTITQEILSYHDTMPTNIRISTLDDAMRAELIARGKYYVELTSKPTLSAHTGTLKRTEPFMVRKFKADGRVMIDYASMRIMDPSYQDYYGVDDESTPHESKNGNAMSIDMTLDDNLVLCSPYVYGFSFGLSIWGEMLVANQSSVKFRHDAYDKLVLDQELKNVILPIVEYTAQVEKNTDIIDGKGGGSVFLLDGNSGIGKTLTAESIAERLERPLYSIGCGELGVSTQELEQRLKNILDMASTWNAVVLLDEADIFLEQRDASNIERNAMVGIFLRLIEYYQGVLFLTTNRIKSLDKAFPSRISLAIHYPDLDAASREKIWKTLTTLANGGQELDMDYAEFAKIPTNGRNIKHIIRLATILAKSEDRKMTAKDIQKMINIQSTYSVENSVSARSDATSTVTLLG